MEVSITNEDRIAIAEVDYIIHHMNERYLEKIPQKIRDCIEIMKKKNIEIYVDPHKPLDKQGLKEFTLHFLMILNLKYWCNDERRKDILSMMENNQRKFEDKVNNIFGQADSMQSVTGSEVVASKPRQITTVGTDTSADGNNASDMKASNEIVKQEEHSNAIDDLKNVEQSIIATENENIFVKILNKIKELKNKLIRSK